MFNVWSLGSSRERIEKIRKMEREKKKNLSSAFILVSVNFTTPGFWWTSLFKVTANLITPLMHKNKTFLKLANGFLKTYLLRVNVFEITNKV